MMEEGLEPLMQLTARDRNLLALQADLLGAWALGVRSVLALSGDPLKVGPYEGIANARSDVDSMGLIKLVAGLNQGTLAAGEELALAAGLPDRDRREPARRHGRAPRRASSTRAPTCFQTNIVYDVERFAEWFTGMVEAGIPQRGPMIVGVTPPRSTRMLRYMHEKIPGIEVDDATFARMEGLEGEEARREGVAIAVDVVRGLRELPHVGGVHMMAPGWEADAVPAVVAGRGPDARASAASAHSASISDRKRHVLPGALPASMRPTAWRTGGDEVTCCVPACMSRKKRWIVPARSAVVPALA